MRDQAIKWIARWACLGLFAAGCVYLSTAPVYRHLEADQAIIRLSISHAGQLLGACHQRSKEELANLSRNMRDLQDCPRERSPVTVELELDNRPWYREVVAPSGLSRDGASTIYQRLALNAGLHRITVRLSDSIKSPGFNYQRSELVQLRPEQVLVIDFNRQQGGILFR